MQTEYAEKINSVPIIYLTFKGCNAISKKIMIDKIRFFISEEYDRYYNDLKNNENKLGTIWYDYKVVYDMLKREKVLDYDSIESRLTTSLLILSKALYKYYNVKPIVIIDEYDNPFIEAKANGYYRI